MAFMLDNIQSLLTPAILSRVSSQTGEPESAVKKGFGAVVPAIVGTIANRSDDHGFMTQLADLATRTAANPDAITSAAGLSPGASTTGMMSPIQDWFLSLFGNNFSALAGSVARYAGIGGSTATSLLSIGAPLVLTYIGRWMRRDNLDATRLADELRGQRSQIAAAMPAGFDLPTGLRAIAQPAVAYAPQPAAPAWNIPMLILLGALGLGGLLWWGVREYHERTQATIGQGMSTLVGTAGTVGGTIVRELPDHVTVRFPRGGIEDVLSSYLASPVKGTSAFEFDRIGFEMGSASLTPQSREQLRTVALILNAYPAASVTIAGYTDNVGDEAANLALSQARAESVARELTYAGVTPARVGAQGFGSKKPIASNLTEAGRSQNRRVMLDVFVK
jgi:outer membrane protein OmpA-like peptidoglycan-associated protein